MSVTSLFERFAAFGDRDALLGTGHRFSFRQLSCGDHASFSMDDNPGPGCVVVLAVDHTPQSAYLLLDLLRRRCIVAPLARGRLDFDAIADEVDPDALIDGSTGHTTWRTTKRAKHHLLSVLRSRDVPGLLVFTSGSSGLPKGAVHDAERFFQKYEHSGKSRRTLLLLGIDHIAGLDALLAALASGGSVAFPISRRPDDVCRAIEQHRVEVLPASPTFLNMLMLDGSWRRYDFESLRIVTYGSEVMHKRTLVRCMEAFPKVRFLQRYGLTELGAVPGRCDESDPAWIELDGRAQAWRVVDGQLEIKSGSAMLGYINAVSPFTEDRWYRTGDLVEQRGTRIRVLGRAGNLINVGGHKIHPSEVEDTLKELEGVEEAVVYSEPHPLLGHALCAKVLVSVDARPALDARCVKAHCRARLDEYKVPMRVVVVTEGLVTDRMKRSARV